MNAKQYESSRREIKIHQKLDHPSIIKFFGWEQRDNKIFQILELAEKGNLINFIRNKKGKIIIENIRSIYRKVCEGVLYLHEHGIVHRDLKPENILLDKDLYPKICDFGWAAEISKNECRGTFCGTYEYMAPEIFENEQYNGSVDIWSLGVLLYEMIHNKSPYNSKSVFKIYKNIV